ncbi:MAG: pilus assembly protein PilP [Myxococcota bacterium]|nr:pilus assembly protein PilP [Myxococcota bacterium]
MQRIRIASLLLVLGVLALACQKQTAGPSVNDYQKQRAAIIEKQRKDGGKAQVAATQTEQEGEETDPAFAASGRGYVYDPLGKRDPFRSFILDRVTERDASAKGPLEQFDLSQLSVTGVVWETDKRRALVLDPSGRNYIVQEGDPIGKNDGRVISITDASVTVREAYVDFHGDRTTKEIDMRVRQSQGG